MRDRFPIENPIEYLWHKSYVLNDPASKPVDVILDKAKVAKELGIVEEVETWIDDYRQLFKKSGRSGVMGSRKACVVKMRRFLEEYDYSKDIILSATERYINTQAVGGFMFLQQADNFIHKEITEQGKKVPTSRLESFCEEVTELPDTNGTVGHGKEFV